MHETVDIDLTFSDGSHGTMHFVLNPRIGSTQETAKTVWREPTDENIQREINRTRLWLPVESWRRK